MSNEEYINVRLFIIYLQEHLDKFDTIYLDDIKNIIDYLQVKVDSFVISSNNHMLNDFDYQNQSIKKKAHAALLEVRIMMALEKDLDREVLAYLVRFIKKNYAINIVNERGIRK